MRAECHTRGMTTWDAQGYDDRFSFVTTYGSAVLDLLAARPGERVLDLGCGTGHQAAELAAAGVTVVGLDADAAMLEVARAEHPEVAFVEGDAQSIDVLRLQAAAGGPYDAVFSNAALHWLPRQDDVAAGVRALLRPEGRFVAEMGGAGNVAAVTAAIRAGRGAVGLDPDIPTPWTFPTPGELATRLEANGFAVELVQHFRRPTPLAVGDSPADWAAMMGAGLVADVPADRRAEFDRAVDARAAMLGLSQRADGEPGWWADYARLRFVARVPDAVSRRR